MNQRQLKYFLEVYSTKSISKAAANLFVTPQGISKTIAALEKELNVSLFEHHHNRITPTKDAARLSVRFFLAYPPLSDGGSPLPEETARMVSAPDGRDLRRPRRV